MKLLKDMHGKIGGWLSTGNGQEKSHRCKLALGSY